MNTQGMKNISQTNECKKVQTMIWYDMQQTVKYIYYPLKQ